eukprot:7286626-Lingulodinium_polyedra.AAC.1
MNQGSAARGLIAQARPTWFTALLGLRSRLDLQIRTRIGLRIALRIMCWIVVAHALDRPSDCTLKANMGTRSKHEKTKSKARFSFKSPKTLSG